MSLLVLADERCALHIAGRQHPERPERLEAVAAGLLDVEKAGALEWLEPEPATAAALERVHGADYIAGIESFCLTGGGRLDPDTGVVPASFPAALLAAGSGLVAVDALRAGRGASALCAVRPPGHHARPNAAMGFCLFNNVAVTAAALAEAGERVLIVDVDVHHGNGTQEMFWDDPRVGYVSIHQWPWYPGSGSAEETGGLRAPGSTLNIPVPAGATGDVYDAALDDLIVPFAEWFAPDWLCVSLGFDAHRSDPLADVRLSAADYGRLIARVMELGSPGRGVVFLEGGYDLDAVVESTAATAAALTGTRRSAEPPTSGGPGSDAIEALVAARRRAGLPG